MVDEAAAPAAPAPEFELLDERAAALEPAAELVPGSSDEPAAPAALDWSIAAGGLVAAFAYIADGWELNADEQGKLAGALVPVLDQFFPDVRLDPRWQSLGAFAAVAGAIAMQRFEGGRLKPLRKARAPRADEAPAAPSVAADHAGLVLRPSAAA